VEIIILVYALPKNYRIGVRADQLEAKIKSLSKEGLTFEILTK
jgi:hypothetical protein